MNNNIIISIINSDENQPLQQDSTKDAAAAWRASFRAQLDQLDEMKQQRLSSSATCSNNTINNFGVEQQLPLLPSGAAAANINNNVASPLRPSGVLNASNFLDEGDLSPIKLARLSRKLAKEQQQRASTMLVVAPQQQQQEQPATDGSALTWTNPAMDSSTVDSSSIMSNCTMTDLATSGVPAAAAVVSVPQAAAVLRRFRSESDVRSLGSSELDACLKQLHALEKSKKTKKTKKNDDNNNNDGDDDDDANKHDGPQLLPRLHSQKVVLVLQLLKKYGVDLRNNAIMTIAATVNQQHSAYASSLHPTKQQQQPLPAARMKFGGHHRAGTALSASVPTEAGTRRPRSESAKTDGGKINKNNNKNELNLSFTGSYTTPLPAYHFAATAAASNNNKAKSVSPPPATIKTSAKKQPTPTLPPPPAARAVLRDHPQQQRPASATKAAPPDTATSSNSSNKLKKKSPYEQEQFLIAGGQEIFQNVRSAAAPGGVGLDTLPASSLDYFLVHSAKVMVDALPRLKKDKVATCAAVLQQEEEEKKQ